MYADELVQSLKHKTIERKGGFLLATMMFYLILLFCTNTITLSAAAVETCTEEYKALEYNGIKHDMCLTDSEDIIYSGISDAEAQHLVDEHNRYRRMVSPTAKNMAKVYWNAEVAQIAQKWANQCLFEHDTSKARRVASLNTNAGQNIFLQLASENAVSDPANKLEFLTGPTQSWYEDEVGLFTYGGNYTPGTGHYTQVVYDDTLLIGCGYTGCKLQRYTSSMDDSWSDEWFERVQETYLSHLVVCNYVSPRRHAQFPYEEGQWCAACPNTCDNKLCDCGDQACYNGGSINVGDCTCECLYGFEGDHCETLSAGK